MQTPAFGAVERTPDPRDFQLATIATPNPIPLVFMQDWSKLAVEMQSQIPACGSHGGSFLKDIQETLQNGTAQRKSPMYLWKKIKLIDGIAPESGTDMLSIFKALKESGVCDSSLMPNDTSLSLAAYTDPSTITKEMDLNAQNARIQAYAFQFSPLFDDIKRAIYEQKGVLMLIRIGSEFWTPSWAENDILPLRPPASIVSGHFVVAHSYDEKRIYFRNEWSDAWGRKGDGYFEQNYIPYVAEIGTAFDVPVEKFMKDLYYGSVGADVMALQKYLVANKFGNFVPTAFFGEKTLESVKLFQAKYGIPNTGYVGVLTRTKLNTLVV